MQDKCTCTDIANQKDAWKVGGIHKQAARNVPGAIQQAPQIILIVAALHDRIIDGCTAKVIV